jgi:hypothetical protein
MARGHPTKPNVTVMKPIPQELVAHVREAFQLRLLRRSGLPKGTVGLDWDLWLTCQPRDLSEVLPMLYDVAVNELPGGRYHILNGQKDPNAPHGPQLKVCNLSLSELSAWRSKTCVAMPLKVAGLPSLSLPLALRCGGGTTEHSNDRECRLLRALRRFSP